MRFVLRRLVQPLTEVFCPYSRRSSWAVQAKPEHRPGDLLVFRDKSLDREWMHSHRDWLPGRWSMKNYTTSTNGPGKGQMKMKEKIANPSSHPSWPYKYYSSNSGKSGKVCHTRNGIGFVTNQSYGVYSKEDGGITDYIRTSVRSTELVGSLLKGIRGKWK